MYKDLAVFEPVIRAKRGYLSAGAQPKWSCGHQKKNMANLWPSERKEARERATLLPLSHHGSIWPQPAGSQSSWEPSDTAGTASSKTDGDAKGERPCYRQMDNVHEVDGGLGQVGP